MLATVASAAAVYAGIRVDIARAHAKAEAALSAAVAAGDDAEKAHGRIDWLLQRTK